ncbi:NEDD8-activating enzyme E1 regulatory subunit axr1 [Asimina triloba]
MAEPKNKYDRQLSKVFRSVDPIPFVSPLWKEVSFAKSPALDGLSWFVECELLLYFCHCLSIDITSIEIDFLSVSGIIRIWGEHGQSALEKASICLLNCGPTGSETLKNLVLGGIGSITVVDGSKVDEVDAQSIGQSKAKCVCAFLQELNDAVKAKFVEESPEALIETNPSFFNQFTLVIATQIQENSMLKLDEICRQANIMLIVARSYGLTGFVRISLKEHDVIESKPDHFLDDLRLHNPWPELKQFAESIDINTVDTVVHKHIPYVVILVKMAEEWSKTHNGCLPSTREEKRGFKELLKSKMLSFDEDNYKEAIEASFKVSTPGGISPNIQQIINDSHADVDATSPDFWVLVAALKEFIENEGNGEPPLEGSIPDMTSLTEHYIRLQKIYQAKAEADTLAIEQRVQNILKKIGRDPLSIPKATVKSFCRNTRKLTVCRYRLIEDEFNSPVVPELQKYLTDEDYSVAVGFYILLRAVDRFASIYNRFPGVFDGEMDEDISRLKTIAVGILNDLGCNGSNLSEDLINEMCRFGGAELHAVAAFIGGIASQEIIKLITKQFVPMCGTFIFNGVDHKSQLLAL